MLAMMCIRNLLAALVLALPGVGLAQAIPGDQHPETPPAAADPAQRLEELFHTLADPDASDAALVQRRIAEIWSRSGSDSMDLLLTRGREALDAEEYAKALSHFTALTELDPGFAEGWNARATAEYLLENYWAAVADIQRTLRLEPRHFGALAGLGIILERTGDEAAALRVHREALRINPHLEGAREAVERLAPKIDGRGI